MASNLGTVFVEISLDDKVFKQKLSETLTSTQTTAKGIETAWKALGTKSEASFDAQRKAAENAYTLIKNYAGSSANDIVRAQQAMSDKIKSIHEKQYGHQTTIIESIKSNWLAASAAVVAAWYAVSGAVNKAVDVAMIGARYETLGVVMRVVGQNAGYTSAEMDKYSVALQGAGISMIESRQSLARMVQAQLDLSNATKLARVAQDAAVIGNINSSEAFQRLVYGIQSAQVEMLRTIGINVNFENSYAKVAAQTGRNAASFSETEKATIRMNAVIESGAKIAGTYEQAMETAGKQITSFPRYLEDFKVKMGEAFNPATSALVDAATIAIKELQKEISKPEAQQAIQDMSQEFARLAISAGQDLPKALEKTLSSLRAIMAFYNSLPEGAVGATGADMGLRVDEVPIIAHRGERVLSRQETADYERGGGLTINLIGTVIDRQAVNEFAERIYPQLKKLEKWGH